MNISIHIVASLLLFGFIFLTLKLPKTPERYRDHAMLLATAIALLWAIHPLQTQSVTYIVQRYESLMGMCFLLSLFCFVKGFTSKYRAAWYLGSVIACAASAMCKEVAVVIPLVVLWYDRAFLAESWRELFRDRWLVYVGLFASWLILAQVAMVPIENHNKHGTVLVHEVDFTGDQPIRTVVGPREYLYSQAHAIPFYLQLTVLPMGQSLDHGWRATYSLAEAIWPGVIVVAALGLTIWCVFRAPRWSFVGASFFLILAPTSSILPIQDIVFEHRMYLPLASLLTLIVFGIYEGLRRTEPEQPSSSSHLSASQALVVVLAVLVIVYGGVSIARNEVYRDDESMWRDVLAKNPSNPRAYHGIAHAYVMQGDWAKAIPYLEKTIELHPEYPFKGGYANTFLNGAKKSIELGDVDMALKLLDLTIKMNPQDSEAYFLMAKLIQHQNPRQSIALLHLAIDRDPQNEEAQQLLKRLTQ
ncbi:tetratricopeptide repeat protein [Bremerella volcania]|uniref:tetratricopeptide repeat protein n=1 Tax=Bremerella volcania TaxID=2527984 RepID=UPI0013FCF91B|nr:tetratricopeptide repeat protein [Bremerella volcania]